MTDGVHEAQVAAAAAPFGVGIVGAGGILKRQALAYRALPGLARMVAVADIDPDRAEAARRQWGMDFATKDPRELIAHPDVQVVSICTRPDTHARLTEEAIAAGKHVLVEKPLARTLAEADALVQRCGEHPDVRVGCLYQWRADPAMRLVRALLEESALGRPLLAEAVLRSWRPAEYYEGPVPRESWDLDGGGVVAVMGIHQLDALVHLLGDAVEVSAAMDRFVRPSEGEDALVGTVRFASGAIATVRFSVLDQRDSFWVEVLGRKACARVVSEGPQCRWEIEARDRALERALRARGRREAPSRSRFEPSPFQVKILERLYRMRRRTWLPPRNWWHRPFIETHLRALRDGTPVPVEPADARRSLELTVALYQAALTRSVVRLPLGPESPFYAGVEPSAFRPETGEKS